MRTWKNNQGFTLVELLVTIVIASIVTFAVVTFLLLGIRMNKASNDTVRNQQDVRIILSLVEDLAGNGQIKTVKTQGADWSILDADENSLLRYSVSDETLYSGAGAVILDGILSSSATLNDSLLTFRFDTEQDSYSTSVYCRIGITAKGNEIVSKNDAETIIPETSSSNNMSEDVKGKEGRLKLLQTLLSEYNSDGRIKTSNNGSYDYYSEWYIGEYTNENGWNENTPWCACFLSWACAKINEDGNNYLVPESIPRFADVDAGAVKFRDETYGIWADGNESPNPGDFIFFDWDGDKSLDHVGCVLGVKDGVVYTIEGNSGGKVATHRYFTSSNYIAGFGVLDWK